MAVLSKKDTTSPRIDGFRYYLAVLFALLFIGCSSAKTSVKPSGSAVTVPMMVMPVRGIEPKDLTDNFAAPRDNGARKHEGLDIMAPMGREILACKAGLIQSRKWNDLGGNSIWLKGDDGWMYYYAHLSRYREEVTEGTHVLAGEVIGYVGNTGDAQGKSPHLHFEIHQERRSPAVDPFSILRQDGILVMPMPIDSVLTMPAKATKKRR